MTPSDSDLPPGLAQPAVRALHAAGRHRLDAVARFSEAELLQPHGVGPNAIEKLRVALAERGLSFAKKQ